MVDLSRNVSGNVNEMEVFIARVDLIFSAHIRISKCRPCTLCVRARSSRTRVTRYVSCVIRHAQSYMLSGLAKHGLHAIRPPRKDTRITRYQPPHNRNYFILQQHFHIYHLC